MKFPTKENFNMFIGSVTTSGLQSRSGLFSVYSNTGSHGIGEYIFKACRTPGMFLYNFEVKA